MSFLSKLNWTKVCLFNLIVVAILGVLMRYKIVFEFPFVEQKNLLLAHSNFALTGWISLFLMFLITRVMKSESENSNPAKVDGVLLLNLFTAVGMMLSLAMSGHGAVSHVFMVASLLSNVLFSVVNFKSVLSWNGIQSKNWFLASYIFNILSVLGMLFIIYMMRSGSLEQEKYLASIYWQLHFQYNGWFFFGAAGLVVHFLQKQQVNLVEGNRIFWMFAISCIPTFGLSVLWLDLPVLVFAVVAAMTVLQFYAWLKVLLNIRASGFLKSDNFDWIGKLFILCVVLCVTVKLCLQLGSIIPAVSKFAFGFRPIVIAYLHLVFLAIFSVFLLIYTYIDKIVIFGKTARIGLVLFLISVLLNELILGIQGVASINYTLVPFANQVLFIVSILILVSVLMIFTVKKVKYD